MGAACQLLQAPREDGPCQGSPSMEEGWDHAMPWGTDGAAVGLSPHFGAVVSRWAEGYSHSLTAHPYGAWGARDMGLLL